MVQNRLQQEAYRRDVVLYETVTRRVKSLLLTSIISLKGPGSNPTSFPVYKQWIKEAMDALTTVYSMDTPRDMKDRLDHYRYEFSTRFPLEKYIEMDRYFVEETQRREGYLGFLRQSPFTGRYTRKEINRYMVQTIFRYLASEQLRNIEKFLSYITMLKELVERLWMILHAWIIKHRPAMVDHVLSPEIGGFDLVVDIGESKLRRSFINYNNMRVVKQLKRFLGVEDSYVGLDIEYPREYVFEMLGRPKAFDDNLYAHMAYHDELREINDWAYKQIREASEMTPSDVVIVPVWYNRVKRLIGLKYDEIRRLQRQYDRYDLYFDDQKRRMDSTIWTHIREWENAARTPFFAGNDRQVKLVDKWIENRMGLTRPSSDERDRLVRFRNQYYILALDLLRITYIMEKKVFILGETIRHMGRLERRLQRLSPGKIRRPATTGDSIRGEEPAATPWAVF